MKATRLFVVGAAVGLLIVIALGLLLLTTTVFDPEPSPDVMKAFKEVPLFEGPCAQARLTLMGFGNPDPITKGREILEALQREGDPDDVNLKALGFKTAIFPPSQTRITDKEFADFSQAFRLRAYCEPSSARSMRAFSLPMLRGMTLYFDELLRRAEAQGADWFWTRAEDLVAFSRALLLSETSYLHKAVTASNLLSIRKRLTAELRGNPRLAAKKPVGFDELFHLRSRYRDVLLTSANYELRVLGEMFGPGAWISDNAEDFTESSVRLIAARFGYRKNETANEYMRVMRETVDACDRGDARCGQNEPEFRTSLTNWFGRVLLQLTWVKGKTFEKIRERLEKLEDVGP